MPPGLRIAGSAAHGGKPLFTGLDLSVEPGKWTCLLGVSGVGKTTILRLVAGLEIGGIANWLAAEFDWRYIYWFVGCRYLHRRSGV